MKPLLEVWEGRGRHLSEIAPFIQRGRARVCPGVEAPSPRVIRSQITRDASRNRPNKNADGHFYLFPVGGGGSSVEVVLRFTAAQFLPGPCRPGLQFLDTPGVSWLIAFYTAVFFLFQRRGSE